MSKQKLSDVLPELHAEIERFRKRIGGFDVKARRTEKRAYQFLLYENYQEVEVIFRRLIVSLQQVEKIQAQLWPKEGQPALPHDLQRQFIAAMRSVTETFPVDVKSMYLWTAQIADIYSKSGSSVDVSELKRIALLRHNFITHVHETPLFQQAVTTRSGHTFHPGNEHVELLFHPFIFKDRYFKGLSRLAKKTSVFIPELKGKENHWDRLYTLYRGLNRIPDQALRRDVQKKIFALGNATEPPVVLAQALLVALQAFLKLR